MSRTLQNLYRLRCKMQVRYGNNDETVLQLDREIAAREVVDAQLSMPAPVTAGRFFRPRTDSFKSLSAGY
jgi:hypothetical protein